MTSAINPQNIDGAYPVAGQDNNSQGFRDNFTNTKTNFQYAADEITDLQNKAVLKAALTGTTLNNDMLGSVLSNAQLQDMSETRVALGTLSGAVTINYAAGSYQTVTTNGSISLAFTNFPAAGAAGTVAVEITVSSTAHTVTLPSAVGSGSAATSAIGIQGLDTMTNVITFANLGTYVYEFWTTDGGSTVYINDLTQGRNYFTSELEVADISVTGNITVDGRINGNVVIDSIESVTGNVTAGNILTSGKVSAVGNITGSYFIGNGSALTGITATSATTAGTVTTAAQANITSVGTLTSVTVSGNVQGGNIRTAGLVSSTGNVTGGNIVTTGTSSRYLDVDIPNYANITATGTYSLSTASSINILTANNTGYTATLNMPTTPQDGQICNFAVHGNTVTLAVGTGTVLPTFAGSATVGTGFRYVYRVSNTSWYKIG
jgi:hypothetical protein